MEKKISLVLSVGLMIVIAGGAFYGGYLYGGKSKQSAMPGGFNGQFAQRSQDGSNANSNRTRSASGFVNGEILKKDDKSLTIKMIDGGSKTVYLSDKTSITKSVDGASDDLEVGKTVMVNGTTASDGSTVAQYIQIRPDNASAGQMMTPGAQDKQTTTQQTK